MTYAADYSLASDWEKNDIPQEYIWPEQKVKRLLPM